MTDQSKLENCDSASAKETCFNYAERKQFIQKLFRQHYRQMYRLATILLHDDAESKDVVHDIFAHLLDDPKGLKEETAEHYLLTSVRNRCLNGLEEELKALYKGIDQLEPPVCRDIIMQHFRDGITFKEIANRLGVSETTVYKHLRRALNQLRTHLKNK